MPEIGKLEKSVMKSMPVYFPEPDVLVDASTLSNEEWKKYRTKGIGGSDLAAVMEISPWTSKQDLYFQKIGVEPKITEHEDDSWFIFAYGHAVEDLVAQAFAKKSGLEVMIDTRMYAHKDYPHMLANIDRVVKMPDGKMALLECKTTTYFNKDAWAGSAPRYYELQCRHYMAVCNVDVCFIACIFGNTPADFICHRIDRDLSIEKEIIEAELEFWEGNVLSKIEPSASGIGKKDIEVIRKYGGLANPTLPELVLDSSYLSLIEEYLKLDEKRKACEKKALGIKESQAALQVPFWEALACTTKACVPIPPVAGAVDEEYYAVSIVPRKGTEVDKDRLKLVYPEAYADCVKVKAESSRTFSLKRKRGLVSLSI